MVNPKAGATHIVGFISNIYSLRLSDFTRQSQWEKECVTDSIHLLAHKDFVYGWNHCYEFVVCCSLSILGHDFRYKWVFTQILPLWSKKFVGLFSKSVRQKKNISILFSSSLLIKTPGKLNCLLTMYFT